MKTKSWIFEGYYKGLGNVYRKGAGMVRSSMYVDDWSVIIIKSKEGLDGNRTIDYLLFRVK